MRLVLAFDVYGTLIDTQGIAPALEPFAGARAADVAQLWRDKQLEYTFRRAAMGRYTDFDTVTAQALAYCSEVFELEFSTAEHEAILAAYRTLPAYDDVADCLRQARDSGHAPYAFSNGTAATVNGLLEQAGVRDLLIDVISVDALATFKPDPAVYMHFCTAAAVSPARAWLISGNPFDAIGAMNAGMNAAWIRRRAKLAFDPWGIAPTATCGGLDSLLETIETRADAGGGAS